MDDAAIIQTNIQETSLPGEGSARSDALFRGLAIAFLIAGSAVRLRHYLAAPSFWFDETSLLLNVVAKSYANLIGPLDHEQAAPALYLLGLRGLYDLFGCNEWSMRLPALLGGIATIWLAAAWSRYCLGWPGTFCVVVLGAVSTHGLQHADEVKPYALDAMWSVVVLHVAARTLDGGASVLKLALLIGLAALGPWASYPMVFALAGVALAWLIAAIRRRDPILAAGLLAYGIIALASCGICWWLVVRHQQSRYLHDWWSAAFWDLSGPYCAMRWIIHCAVDTANYAATGTGLPFILLAPLGMWQLARRTQATVWTLMGMVLAALLANALGKYPLEGRVTFFMAPAIWMVLGAAADGLCQRTPERWRWVFAVLVLTLAASDIARTSRASIEVHSNGDFRSAIDHVHQHWQTSDLLWQWSTSEYEIYHGKEKLDTTLLVTSDAIPAAQHGQRLWLIAPPEAEFALGMNWSQLQERLQTRNWRPVAREQFHGVEVILFEASIAPSADERPTGN